MNTIRNRNSAFCMLLVLGSVLLSNPAKAATVYWGLTSFTYTDTTTVGGMEYEPYRHSGAILDFFDIYPAENEFGLSIPVWRTILEFTIDYDLENEIVKYGGGLSGEAKFGESVRLFYTTLLRKDGELMPAVGYVDFTYEDEPVRDITIGSSYLSIGSDATLPIPEPCSGGMMMLGFAFLLLRRRLT